LEEDVAWDETAAPHQEIYYRQYKRHAAFYLSGRGYNVNIFVLDLPRDFAHFRQNSAVDQMTHIAVKNLYIHKKTKKM